MGRSQLVRRSSRAITRPKAPHIRGLHRFERPEPSIYRGMVFVPLSDTKYQYYSDGAVAINNLGRIEAVGPYREVRRAVGNGYREVDLTTNGERPAILPTFTDTHVHFPQYEVKGLFGGNLMNWLREHIWPEENKFADPDHADRVSIKINAALAKVATTMAGVYSSIHGHATMAFLRHAVGQHVVGPVWMTQNSPDYLLQRKEDAIIISEQLARMLGSSYGVTPRFAPTCDIATLIACGNILRKYGCFLQTHLNEDKDQEIPFVRELFPWARDYTDVYDRAGLLGPRTIMGHVIYSTEAELIRLAQTLANVAHCPTSNIALENNRMPIEAMKAHGIHYSLGSDVGAGPSLSMLHVMQAYHNIHNAAGVTVGLPEAVYRGTLAGAQTFGLGNQAGTLLSGYQGNLAILRSPGTTVHRKPAILLRKLMLDPTQADCEEMVIRTVFMGRTIWAA